MNQQLLLKSLENGGFFSYMKNIKGGNDVLPRPYASADNRRKIYPTLSDFSFEQGNDQNQEDVQLLYGMYAKRLTRPLAIELFYDDNIHVFALDHQDILNVKSKLEKNKLIQVMTIRRILDNNVEVEYNGVVYQLAPMAGDFFGSLQGVGPVYVFI